LEAHYNDWDNFDTDAQALSNDPIFLNWAESSGLAHNVIHLRDLAITIFENTSTELTPDQTTQLNTRFREEENLHLKRKIAIALFRHGDESDSVMAQLDEAYKNDEELREQVGILLGI
jgi:hypothetical protein